LRSTFRVVFGVLFLLVSVVNSSKSPGLLDLNLNAGCGRVLGNVYNGTLPYRFVGDCQINIPAVKNSRVLQRYNYEILQRVGNLSIFAFQINGPAPIFDFKCGTHSSVSFIGLDTRSHMTVESLPCTEFDVFDGGAVSMAVQLIQPEEYRDSYGTFYGYVGFSYNELGYNNNNLYFTYKSQIGHYGGKVQFYPYQNPMSRIYCSMCAIDQGGEGTYAKGNCISGMLWYPSWGWTLAEGDSPRVFFCRCKVHWRSTTV
jgi:hypothetical protein